MQGRMGDIAFEGPTPNRIAGLWRIEAAGRELRSPAASSGMYRNVELTSLDDLCRTGHVEGLAACYREVFGSGETTEEGDVVWGEGARCGECHAMMPLALFREVASAEHPVCPACGEGLLAEIFPIDRMISTLQGVLAPRPGWDPVVAVITGDGRSVPGFMYGAVTAPEAAVSRMSAEQSVYPDAPSRTDLMRFFGNAQSRLLLYIEALAITPDWREGMNAIKGLVSLTYSRAVELGATGAIAWTNPRSQAFGLMLAHGYEIVGALADYVYLYLADIRSVATALQSMSDEDTAELVQKAFAVLLEDGTLMALDRGSG